MSELRTTVTKADLIAGLYEVGVRRGDILGVHSALSKFGHVEGGAETVVAALMETVGPEGALVMQAYPLGPGLGPTPEEAARGVTWKVKRLPWDPGGERTGIGIVADTFRRWPGVQRGVQPLFSLTAWGRGAHELCQGNHALLEQDGCLLLLGVQMDRCSVLHQAEGRVALPEDIRRRMTPPPALQQEYERQGYLFGYGPEANFLLAQEEAERQGLVRQVQIGAATVRYFGARPLVDIYEHLLREEPYRVYGLPVPD